VKPYNPFKKEQRQIKGKFHPRRQKSRREEAEFGLGKENILVCEKCSAVYCCKSWKARFGDVPRLKESKNIKFVLCPACQQILEKKYEGEIILENVPNDFKEEIRALVKNYGKKASMKDPMDRVISIEEQKICRVTAGRKRKATSRKNFRGLKNIRILTTENQLAVRLAQKINEIFGGKLSISYSHQEDTARIKITF